MIINKQGMGGYSSIYMFLPLYFTVYKIKQNSPLKRRPVHLQGLFRIENVKSGRKCQILATPLLFAASATALATAGPTLGSNALGMM